MYNNYIQVAINQGINLNTYLRIKGVNKENLAKEAGIPRATLYSLFKKEIIPSEYLDKIRAFTDFNPEQEYSSETGVYAGDARTVFVTVDRESNEVIKIVNEKAKAGYLAGERDQEYWEHLKTAQLPEGKFSEATMRGFEIEGDSMSPRINNGDIVFCTWVEPSLWYSLKEFYVYVIVTHNDIFCKRIRSRIKQDNTLLCYSDNMDYEPFTVDASELREIWRVRRLYSGNLSKIK